jgi:pimeloyl-ACP methyl ester carboxylesterase
VGDVESGYPNSGRSVQIHYRSDHLMGNAADIDPQAVRTAPCAARIQRRVSSFANGQAQTVESGCRGKRAYDPDGRTVPIVLSLRSVSSMHFPWNRDQISGPDQARNLHRALDRSDLHLVQNAGHIVTYADTADIAEAVETVRGLDAGRIVPGETRTDQRSG